VKHTGNNLLVYEIQIKSSLTVLKASANPLYPSNPRTFGERLRKWRMDNGMLAKELGKLLGVDLATVFNWELNKTIPLYRQCRKIREITGLEFEYTPKDRRKHKPAPGSLGEKLRNKRLKLGLTLKELSKILGISVSTLVCLESPTHQREMLAKNREKIEEFLKMLR
jgi:transcriptional regulator with XRE-family HTH domain